MNKINLAYMAGFFDGEGCINIKVGKKDYLGYRLGADISQTKEEGKQLCEWFKSNFGGWLQTRKRGKYHAISYNWFISSRLTSRFLKQIYPYLRIKKKQAELAIEFQEKLSSYWGKFYISPFEKIEKYSYYETAKQEMRFLNKKGRNEAIK